jgi:hypothetical protein
MYDTMTDSTRSSLYVSSIIAEDLANESFRVAVATPRNSKGQFTKATPVQAAARRISEAWYNLANSSFELAWSGK